MIVWRKSSHSGTQDGTECVEVTEVPGYMKRAIRVRDSKYPDGPVLAISRREFRNLLDRLKVGALDL